MFRNRTARQHNFAIVPQTQFPRSKFVMRQSRKQAFNASELIPIYCEEVLPGDSWEHSEAIAARLATPIAPVLDDMNLETFYFFVPNRIAGEYTNEELGLYDDRVWEDFITGADNGTTSVPVVSPAEAAGPTWPIPVGSLADHFGIPIGAYTARMELTAFPFWGYFSIYNQWFRDQNLQPEWAYGASDWDEWTNTEDTWDGMPLRINKVHDYITSSLPWPQKGAPVMLPLGTTAPVIPASVGAFPTFTDGMITGLRLSGDPGAANSEVNWSDGANPVIAGFPAALPWGTTGLVADLATATASTINAIRLAITTQQLLERDARGGSRYVENLLAHWGVRAQDFRLNIPEYLGGSKIPITVNPVAQTANYDAEPADAASAVGNLGAEMHASHTGKTFRYSSTEHGYIIGLAAARSTPTYQQGLRKHWNQRNTRLDFYDPVFANIGEQAVMTTEVYVPLDTTPANEVWGYQERAAEYRYTPNEITGHLRSTSATPMDWWHYAEEFANEPALNAEFITDKTQETLARSLATAPSAQWQAQIIMDTSFQAHVVRIMPAYGVPGVERF